MVYEIFMEERPRFTVVDGDDVFTGCAKMNSKKIVDVYISFL
jgi:hypothetical protein